MRMVELDELEDIELAEGIRARLVNAASMTVMHAKIEKGAVLPEHSHLHEQVVNVIEGELELTVAGKKFILVPGKVMVLPPHIVHSGRGITECRVIDVFHPIREDLGQPRYESNRDMGLD